MIDWLRDDHRDPSVSIGGKDLPIAIRRHARAKRLTMRLAPDGGEVRITLPMWGRTKDALVFAESRAAWLEDQLARIPQQAPIMPGAALAYRGNALLVDWQPHLPRRPQMADDRLLLGGPIDSLPVRVQRWLEAEALRLLDEDLDFYCVRADRDTPELRLSRAQRRWGSCSSRQCIRINWRLIQAPDFVRRSVVAHEVAHLDHFDHSPAFYAQLGQLFEGDLAAADSWLRREGRSLYRAFG